MSNLINEVIARIKYLLPGVYVEIQKFSKNNQVSLTGIVIRAEDSNLAPTIYIDQLMEDGWSADDIALFVIKQYRDHIGNGMEDIAEQLLDYEKIKDHLSIHLVNWQQNLPLWQEVPCTRFLDLAAIVVVVLSKDEEEQAVVKVTKDLIAFWGKIFEEVYSYAMTLFYQEKSYLYTLDDVLTKLTGKIFDSVYPMYILTNAESTYGAARIMDESILCELAKEIQSDLIVIPSSVHECMIVPYTDHLDFFHQAVKEVNQTQIPPEETLSDHVYVYRRETGWYNN